MQSIEDLQKYTPETEKVDTQEKEKQRRRRTKKDTEASREHVCATCGKSYLSYPALYTHNKQKHEGVVRRKDSENSTSVSPVVKLGELLGSGELPIRELLQQDLKDEQKPFQYLRSDYTPTSAYGALTQYLDEKSKILDYQGIQYILFFIFTFRRSIENCDTKEISDQCNKAYMDFLKLLEKEYSDRGWIKQIIQKSNIQSIIGYTRKNQLMIKSRQRTDKETKEKNKHFILFFIQYQNFFKKAQYMNQTSNSEYGKYFQERVTTRQQIKQESSEIQKIGLENIGNTCYMYLNQKILKNFQKKATQYYNALQTYL